MSEKALRWIINIAGIVCLCSSISTEAGVTNVIRKVVKFNTNKDLLSLHYDHAPDKDDGHSAAADRTILESLFGADWIKSHVVAVSGTYGKNAKNFNTKSDAVMDVVWNDRGAWLAAHTNRKAAVATLIQKWGRILKEGGDVWVKEGGQSDITADTVKAIQKKFPDVDTTKRIHCIQHSSWNENQTTDTDLAYAKKQTHYVKIRDANAYLNIKGGNTAFETAATRLGPNRRPRIGDRRLQERLQSFVANSCLNGDDPDDLAP